MTNAIQPHPPTTQHIPQHAAEVRQALGRLRELATRLDHQASLIRNGGFNPRAEAEAGRLADDAFAIRWALRRIAPEAETLGQVFATLRAAGTPFKKPRG